MRKLQYRLRLLFLIMLIASLLICASIPLICQHSKSAQQMQAAEKIRLLGGDVGFSHGFLDAHGFREELWYAIFAPSAIKAVVTVDLQGTKISNDDLDILREMPELEAVDVSNTAIDDGVLPHLQGVPSLQIINLKDTNVSAAGLDELRVRFPNATIYY